MQEDIKAAAQENLQAKSADKMGTMPVNKLIITMALPMIVSMLVQAMYNIVDSVFVAGVSYNAFTALSLAFPWQNLMIAVAVGTGVGVNALLSKSLGEGNYERANRVAGNSIVLAILSSLVFVILGFTLSGTFFEFQVKFSQGIAKEAVDEVIEAGKEYISICSVISIGIFMQVCFERLLQATGKTKFVMISQMAGAITNIVLDYVFIKIFGWGVAGAAYATVIGQCLGAALAGIFCVRFNKDIHFHIKYLKLSGKVLSAVYKVGVPSIIMSAIGSLMVFLMNLILIRFEGVGMDAVTIFGVYFKLMSMVFMPVFGLNNGIVPIIAYNFGAKQHERIKKTTNLSLIYATAIMAIGFLIMQIEPSSLILLMLNNFSLKNVTPEMQTLVDSIGISAFRIMSISWLFAGASIVCSSVIQAVGKGVMSLMISLMRQLIILLPVAYFLSLTGNLNAVWWSFPIAEFIALIASVIFLGVTIKFIKRYTESGKDVALYANTADSERAENTEAQTTREEKAQTETLQDEKENSQKVQVEIFSQPFDTEKENKA